MILKVLQIFQLLKKEKIDITQDQSHSTRVGCL